MARPLPPPLLMAQPLVHGGFFYFFLRLPLEKGGKEEKGVGKEGEEIRGLEVGDR